MYAISYNFLNKININFLYLRCFVAECDSVENPHYKESWVRYQIPGKISLIEEKFVAEKCLRFKKPANDSCSISSEGQEIEECQNWVFDDSGKTIVQDVSI